MTTTNNKDKKPESSQLQGLKSEVTNFFNRDIDAIKRDIFMHGRWLGGQGGQRGNFEFKDLSDIDLHGARLDSALLTGANLTKADLRGAKLKDVVLIGADLEEADLRDANLNNADLRGANLHKALLTGATLNGADLSCHNVNVSNTLPSSKGTQTILTEAHLGRAILCQAKLVGCDLSGAELIDADLSGADMTASILLGVDLSGAKLRDSILDQAILDFSSHDPAIAAAIAAIGGVVAPTYQELSVTEFVAAIRNHEHWAESAGATGGRLDLDRTLIPCVKMTGRNLAGSRFRHCHVQGGTWTGINLGMADLSYSNFTGITFMDCDMRGIALRRANLTGADFTGSNLDAHTLIGGRHWPSNLEGAILRNANLTNASFNHSVLRRVDFTGCIVKGAMMRGADLEGAHRDL